MKSLLALLVLLCAALPVLAADQPETAYERVVRTGTIRCGYATSNPWIYKDLATGQMKGLTVEIIEEIAKSLNIKLDWAEDTGWANLVTSINAKRVDMGCAPLWVDPERGKVVAFTTPIFFNPVHLYARADDTRFTGKVSEINDPSIRIVTQEANVSLELANRLFPKASQVSVSPMASGEDLALNLVTKKADLLFTEGAVIKNFNAMNEVKLKRVPFADPMRIFAVAFPVDIHEQELRDVLNTAIGDMVSSGRLQAIIKKYQKDYPDAFINVAVPYETAH